MHLAHITAHLLRTFFSPNILPLHRFVIIFTFYMLVGVLYKRFVLGASGVEQIPNVDMWCNCMESISTGCGSVWSKCTGGGSKPISTYAVRHAPPPPSLSFGRVCRAGPFAPH